MAKRNRKNEHNPWLEEILACGSIGQLKFVAGPARIRSVFQAPFGCPLPFSPYAHLPDHLERPELFFGGSSLKGATRYELEHSLSCCRRWHCGTDLV